MTTSPEVALREAFDRALAEGRHDLVDGSIDELWLIYNYPADRFPDGPPDSVVASLERAKARRSVNVVKSFRLFEDVECEDGFAFMEAGGSAGWRPIGAWGADGWDLCDWPYYVVLFRGDRERAIYIEGDISIETFASAFDRERDTDAVAVSHWRHQGEPWAVGEAARPEADLRGPYTGSRL